MSITQVYLREKKQYVPVTITSRDKPEIDKDIIQRWQSIINLTADIVDIPAGLIMKVTESHMEVFCKSETEGNPYSTHDKEVLGSGLYCETVIGTDGMLEIENALEDEKWKDNPDIALSMIAYLGYPIKWPDNEIFGTICVLDHKAHKFSDKYKKLLLEFKTAIELDLELEMNKERLIYLSEMDMLTNTYNRHKTEGLIENEFKRIKRNNSCLSIGVCDLDRFKYINDTYGHGKGDEVLKAFSQAVRSRIRSTDMFGRWGGDEFVLICPDTDKAGIEQLICKTLPDILHEVRKVAKEVDLSYGCSMSMAGDTSHHQMIKRADDMMYSMKNLHKKE